MVAWLLGWLPAFLPGPLASWAGYWTDAWTHSAIWLLVLVVFYAWLHWHSRAVDANIHRFLRVLRELTSQTQFLVITHNRKTMEAADVLYGVTMEEPGLSKLVSVNLAGAVQAAGN